MRPLLIVTAVLLGACSGNRAAQVSPQTDAAIARTSYFTGTPLADREGWYGRILREMREPVLSNQHGDSLPVHRFLWIPTWYHPVVVRIEAGPNGFRLTSKSLSGAGGYDPGSLNHMASYDLNDADMQLLSRLLAEARFWELPTVPPDNLVGLDGAQWVLEVVKDGRYHVVDRWSPRRAGPDAAYRRLGEWLLARSALAPASVVAEY